VPFHRPSELRALLNKWGTYAKKSLSQNFLIDGNIIRNIAREVPSEKGDLILEIGPGPGALTEALIEKETHYIGVEKDTLFFQHLQEHFQEVPNFNVINDDILEFPFEEHFKKFPKHRIHVVGNLPYSITSPILRRLSKHQTHISSVTIMVQDEVGRRMTGRPKTKDFGLLSLGVQFYWNAKYLFKVSPNCFHPPPKIFSCIIHLTPKPLLNVDEEQFFKMLKSAFGVRRKALRGSLKSYGADKIIKALEALNKPPLTRPEELSLEEWHELYQFILH
jgi:16S rRNA (adenine1518-N6/adenine1519-N6)-dimethyltransferase